MAKKRFFLIAYEIESFMIFAQLFYPDENMWIEGPDMMVGLTSGQFVRGIKLSYF